MEKGRRRFQTHLYLRNSEIWWRQCYGVGIDDLEWKRKLGFIDGIMGSEVYTNILKNNLLVSTRKRRIGKYFIFQQDSDPKHTSKKAKEFFSRKQIVLPEWLALGPDFNPIERLWAILD